MITLRLSEIAQALDGQLIGEDITVEQVNTDSRSLVANELFLALKGANFDGHRFIDQVIDKGCSALIVDHQCDVIVPQIIVADTHKALGKFGAFVREKVSPKVVGITGSSGKTTVKEMVAAILSRLGNVLATQGNFNNEIGVPLTLLRLEKTHDYAVVELGANHMGEIAYTSGLVQPDVAIINNIAAAHLEGFGDLCGVARAKGEIFEGLKSGGVAIYNKDCSLASKWQWRLVDKKVRGFSCKNESDCFSSDVILNEDGCATFKLNTYIGNTYIELTVPGKHNVCNAVAAAAIAIEFGATLDDLRLGLAEMAPVKGRLNLHQLSNNIKLIDDTYNANVESIKAATELLASYPGRRILIIGDMGELGADARSYHQEVGEHAAACKIDDLLTLGVLSQSTSDAYNNKTGKDSSHFSERSALITRLKALLTDEEQQISILVKGSRSARMEYVVQDIIQWCESQVTEEQV
ncbi:UDP-N-acetylmuramoyl-tripeptide--D-alanyl-D-alanine ligase [Thalassotalea profundi]|uniref:UDP-N-acetylmuramoyl-tripeptide--D-alanyl-D-alanine ligase n=1 Tax=Thalassotalea profundi TaxID=2036687 RepID=A0ABQ3IUQ7_9GAMM|nr:UDP-N-acetylmuramoyl-tripeptide--D-alanyl-D-alanine ligase [Thalassotalea profundi]GHE95173.1 UDP-N-acetylmuramoyl-tripeptide--D-alanyl-D-alanine ligase [Thalassotalea profundi]